MCRRGALALRPSYAAENRTDHAAFALTFTLTEGEERWSTAPSTSTSTSTSTPTGRLRPHSNGSGDSYLIIPAGLASAPSTPTANSRGSGPTPSVRGKPAASRITW